MDSPVERRPIGDHDWHSPQYVNDWITRDVTRDGQRRPLLERMLGAAPWPHDAEIRVLDVGAGYGLVSEVVLQNFPRARVTLQDYSAPMLDRARERLAQYSGRVTFVLADLTDRTWPAKAGGPFDLVVSGLAVHNLRDEAAMRAVYRDIHGMLKPGGMFLDYDLAGIVRGGVETHLQWLREADFEEAASPWRDEQSPVAIMVARAGGGAGRQPA
jgi:SAM-dependent methyltransferase